LPNGLDVTMDIISGEAKRMENRVKKLLYYTRIDSLREETPKLETFTFGELAYSFKERLAAMKPEVKIEVIGESVELKADYEQLGTVLENLLENALRYAETFIELKAEETNGQRLVSVINDGPSIPNDQVGALFEPYQKGAKGQFGLGLAIVKRIVDRHKGTVNISNLENGVVFRISLPYE
ncbi:MAG TPA: HAMP domain-containing sensor histidine kinase, partial [Candidatus Angelobacter sp.]|nr:HAMP domain-containing sensor histidine kinase [Candidatus Angelobacter sp.]